jgi:hypothetical protein
MWAETRLVHRRSLKSSRSPDRRIERSAAANRELGSIRDEALQLVAGCTPRPRRGSPGGLGGVASRDRERPQVAYARFRRALKTGNTRSFAAPRRTAARRRRRRRRARALRGNSQGPVRSIRACRAAVGRAFLRRAARGDTRGGASRRMGIRAPRGRAGRARDAATTLLPVGGPGRGARAPPPREIGVGRAREPVARERWRAPTGRRADSH